MFKPRAGEGAPTFASYRRTPLATPVASREPGCER